MSPLIEMLLGMEGHGVGERKVCILYVLVSNDDCNLIHFFPRDSVIGIRIVYKVGTHWSLNPKPSNTRNANLKWSNLSGSSKDRVPSLNFNLMLINLSSWWISLRPAAQSLSTIARSDSQSDVPDVTPPPPLAPSSKILGFSSDQADIRLADRHDE